VRGLAERNAVQGIGTRTRRERSHHGIRQPADHGIQRMGAFEALGEGGRAGEERGLAGLAGLTGLPAGKQGLRHD
jgi:hypothetical protein